MNHSHHYQQNYIQDVRKEKMLTSHTSNPSFCPNFTQLYKRILQNESLIFTLEDKIQQSFKLLDQTSCSGEEMNENCNKNSKEVKIENFHNILQTFSKSKKQHFLKQKLFGSKAYDYFIMIDGQFPVQVLKERNFSFRVKLCSAEGCIVKNVNPIKLNLGVCDNDGNWINSCQSGEDFMKGNCQIEIHHGIGEFRKIYPRDVSRGYRDQQLNFVVYAQPSMIKYLDAQNQWEEYVNPMQVEPLIIEKICVRAKKVVV